MDRKCIGRGSMPLILVGAMEFFADIFWEAASARIFGLPADLQGELAVLVGEKMAGGRG